MFCPQCGESNPENAVKCSRCGYELIPPLFTKPSAPKPPPVPFNGIPQTSPLAIWTLVLGILATVCLGPLATIAALIVGFLAISSIGKSNGRLTGSPLAVVGIIISLVGLIIWVAGCRHGFGHQLCFHGHSRPELPRSTGPLAGLSNQERPADIVRGPGGLQNRQQHGSSLLDFFFRPSRVSAQQPHYPHRLSELHELRGFFRCGKWRTLLLFRRPERQELDRLERWAGQAIRHNDGECLHPGYGWVGSGFLRRARESNL